MHNYSFNCTKGILAKQISQQIEGINYREREMRFFWCRRLMEGEYSLFEINFCID